MFKVRSTQAWSQVFRMKYATEKTNAWKLKLNMFKVQSSHLKSSFLDTICNRETNAWKSKPNVFKVRSSQLKSGFTDGMCNRETNAWKSKLNMLNMFKVRSSHLKSGQVFWMDCLTGNWKQMPGNQSWTCLKLSQVIFSQVFRMECTTGKQMLGNQRWTCLKFKMTHRRLLLMNN